jgi:hypothetical protein
MDALSKNYKCQLSIYLPISKLEEETIPLLMITYKKGVNKLDLYLLYLLVYLKHNEEFCLQITQYEG